MHATLALVCTDDEDGGDGDGGVRNAMNSPLLLSSA